MQACRGQKPNKLKFAMKQDLFKFLQKFHELKLALPSNLRNQVCHEARFM